MSDYQNNNQYGGNQYGDNRYGPNNQTPPPYNSYSNQYGPGRPSPQWLNNDPFASGPTGKSRGVAALLAIFLGSLGIQYFYMGKSTPGIICLLITMLSCGFFAVLVHLLSLIQGILMFCMTNSEFESKYLGPMSPSFPIF